MPPKYIPHDEPTGQAPPAGAGPTKQSVRRGTVLKAALLLGLATAALAALRVRTGRAVGR